MTEPGGGVFRSALLSVAMRWTDRLIGFVSTLVLARLLLPDDFGVVALASIVLALMDALIGLGVSVAIIQRQDPTQAHYDTAWTIRLIQYSIVAAVVWGIAPYAAGYFDEARVEIVARVLSLGILLAAFENIGIICFQKEMRFDREFLFVFRKRIVTVIVTLVAAIGLRNYWALVIGVIAGRAWGVILSYASHPMRPRPSLAKFRDIFLVSQWMLLKSIGTFLDKNLHIILVGRVESTSVTGGYSLANDIARMPTTEILAPINRALFPAFVRACAEPSRLRELFLLAQGVQTILVMPLAVGLVLVADSAIPVLLGDRWVFAVPFLQLLAFSSAIQAMTTSANYVLITLGRMGSAALVDWIRVLVFSLAVAVTTGSIGSMGARDIAGLRIAAFAAAFVLTFVVLIRAMPSVRPVDVLRTIARPGGGTIVMTLVVLGIAQAVSLGPAGDLILQSGAGAAAYMVSVLGTWMLAGRPSGAESYIMDKLRRRGSAANTRLPD